MDPGGKVKGGITLRGSIEGWGMEWEREYLFELNTFDFFYFPYSSVEPFFFILAVHCELHNI